MAVLAARQSTRPESDFSDKPSTRQREEEGEEAVEGSDKQDDLELEQETV